MKFGNSSKNEEILKQNLDFFQKKFIIVFNEAIALCKN